MESLSTAVSFNAITQPHLPLHERSDRELIAAYQGGDQASFQHIVMKYETRVFNHCLRMVNDRDESADLTQEVFLRVFRNIAKYQHTYAFYTWLYRITVNCCIDFLRKKRRRYANFPVAAPDHPAFGEPSKETEIPDARFGPENRIERQELNKILNAALTRLPENLRAMIVMKEMEGLTHVEIARLCNCSLGTVKSRMHRARAQLKTLLTPYVDECGLDV